MQFADGYKLYGYLDLFPGLAGFLVPVFLRDQEYCLVDGNGRSIEHFFPVKPSAVKGICPFQRLGLREYCVGGKQVYIYRKADGQILIGDWERLYHKLYDYRLENKYLQRELEDFLELFEAQRVGNGSLRYYGTGRRKTAVARVYLTPGSGKITVNGREGVEVFSSVKSQKIMQMPFIVTNTVEQYDVMVRVRGGGNSGQAGAICHGIARALIKVDLDYRKALKTEGLLTRDPRMKERKKPGRKAARRGPQTSKR